jgi:DNA-binding transcriptional regulator YiaG
MNPDQYKQARQEMGLSVSEWCERLGLPLDTHKNYNSGRRPIPLTVQKHIETLLAK